MDHGSVISIRKLTDKRSCTRNTSKKKGAHNHQLLKELPKIKNRIPTMRHIQNCISKAVVVCNTNFSMIELRKFDIPMSKYTPIHG
jgi:hypothetical protein